MTDDLEALRKKRLQQLMQQQSEQAMQQQLQQQIQMEQIDQQIKIIIQQIMTPTARERLGNIRAANPEFARQIEIMLIQLYQAGRLPKKINDEQLKEILKKIQSQQQRETTIIRR